MKVDLSLVLSFFAVFIAIFAVLSFYINSIKLRGTVYNSENNRVVLDKTRIAMEEDIRRIYDELYRDRGRWEELNHLVKDAAVFSKFRTKESQESGPIDPDRFLSGFGISSKDIKLIPTQVFVLTPLSAREMESYDAVRSACERLGLRAVRGDEQNISGSILPVIIKEISQSRFVIANLNGRNPNVFYEMGIAQALGKDVLMFAHQKVMQQLPFDIAHQRIIFYDSNNELYEDLTAAIGQLGWGMSRSVRGGNTAK
jgi:hypothetical protein